jgi:hypothetical protein
VFLPSVQGSASEDEHAETMSEAVTTHAGPKPIDPNSAMDSAGGRSDPATADMLKALHGWPVESVEETPDDAWRSAFGSWGLSIQLSKYKPFWQRWKLHAKDMGRAIQFWWSFTIIVASPYVWAQMTDNR